MSENQQELRGAIRKVIAEYKKNFAYVDQHERDKWQGIACFQKHWNIEAENVEEMIISAFQKMPKNMIASGQYYPYKMLTEFARSAPETVRGLFRTLYDEKTSLENRYTVFRNGFQKFISTLQNEAPDRTKKLQHYQDLRAIMLYLTCRYPEKYYFYKTSMFYNFRDRVGFSETRPKKKSATMWKVESYHRLCEIVRSEVEQDSELLRMSAARLDDDCYQDEAHHLLTMDVVFYGAEYLSEDFFTTDDTSDSQPKPTPTQDDNTDNEIMDEKMTDVKLNTILYGPPGTGKTYHTVIYAVAIIENKELKEVQAEAYSDVLERYNQYKNDGRIEFITFHQSYGYEEFIEGIKPVVDSGDDTGDDAGNIVYQIQSGIFKRFCERAESPVRVTTGGQNTIINPNAAIWKVSLEGTGDNPTRRECLNNDHIRIGWDSYGKDITDETDFSKSGGRNPLNAFINRMQIGDIVLSCFSATTIDAIGIITGDYEWKDEYTEYKRLRKVKWLVKDIQENILKLNGDKVMTLSSVYRMGNIALSDVYQILEKYQTAPTQTNITENLIQQKQENYVFIIDEINRGNISKIFGELITLIEPSKRIGKPEGMRIRLPYSPTHFGVPQNVYLIGTMNTADRSITSIDTALRRRFSFTEMLPDPAVLKDISVEDISIRKLLTVMNNRIEALYDREHTIGHACFLPLRENPTSEALGEIFADTILPLLQEYFYEDYEKIRLVLGDNQKTEQSTQFIIAQSDDYTDLFGNSDIDFEIGTRYLINKAAFGNPDSYRFF